VISEGPSLLYLADYVNGYGFTGVELEGSSSPVIRIQQLLNNDAELDYTDLAIPKVAIDSGDLIFSWSATLATRIWTRGPALLNQHLFRVDPMPGVDVRWLKYVLDVACDYLEGHMHGSAMTHVTRDMLRSVRVTTPTLDGQRAIADYLDTETARIDALINKKRRMIELLDERFLSGVFAGVCGALTSPTTPTVDSGIEWVGEIPQHYGTPWLGAFHQTQLGKMLNSEAAAGPEQYPYVKNTNVQWDHLDLHDLPIMSFDASDRERCSLRAGDVLVCEGGEVGRAAVWKDDGTNVFFQKALHRVRSLQKEPQPRYLMYCLWAAASQDCFVVEGNQSTIVHLTGEKLREHRFPWPDVDEQKQIVGLLDTMRSRTARATDVLTKQLDLLAERRQALITAAVTGELEIPRVAA